MVKNKKERKSFNVKLRRSSKMKNKNLIPLPENQ